MSQFQTVELFDDADDENDFNSKTNSTHKYEKATTLACKKDIIIQIRDQETSNTNFINYIIEINIKSDDHMWLDKVTEKNWTVLRRYSEFVTLRNALTKRYPACLIPPIPSKINSLNPWHVANQKKDTDFIDSRRQRLEKFLNRILMHPKLRGEIILFNFLQNEENWNDVSLMNDLSEKVGSFLNWRWINVQSRLINLFDNNVNVSYFNELLKSNSLSEDSIKLIERGKLLQDNVKNLLNCLTKVDEQTSLLHHLYKNYGEAFFDWCSMDQSMGDILQSFGHMCDTYSTLIDSPTSADLPIVLPQHGSNAGGIFTSLSWNEISLLLQELYDYGESWIELGGRMAHVQRQLSRQITQTDSKTEQLERLKSGQPIKSGGFSSLTNKFKKSLSESEISDLKANLEATIISDTTSLNLIKTNKELFHHCVKEEVEHFESIRTRDMHTVMHSYACNQLAHSERCLRLWQRARQTLE